jgi:hypothetical protein
MNIIDLGKLIDPEEFNVYVSIAEKLETVIHKYGKEFVFPEYPCWISYENEGGVIGSISFSRHTGKHPILAEMVRKVADILYPMFPENYKPEVNRIHLIRTQGNIPIHKDEAGRLTCINIGIKNSSSAITRMGHGGPREEFKNNHTSIKLKDGHGYLVNTNAFHSVESLTDEPRYLITYGFGVQFDYFRNFLKIGDDVC